MFVRLSSLIRAFEFRHSVLAALLLAAGCHEITPAEAIKLMNDKDQADSRRTGIAAIVTRWDFGKKQPYPAQYRDIAINDKDPSVRAMAIRALSICREKSATDVFITGLSDEDEQVRLESAKALANVPDPKAVEHLIQILSGSRYIMDADHHEYELAEGKDIRIAAAHALGQYKSQPDAVRSLVEYLNGNDFGVAWQCRQSLIELTGNDFGYDEATWLKYLVGAGKQVG